MAPFIAFTIPEMSLLTKFKQRARKLKADTYALYLAARHPQTPWYAKLFVAFVVAYAFSPIDLIPDFVPVLGYLDDLILLPMGIALAIRLIPPPVLTDCRARAQEQFAGGKPVSRIAGAVIIVLWVAIAALGVAWGYRAFNA
jgi:uncharacterized membrane protein YkvA (DUF1232 family)